MDITKLDKRKVLFWDIDTQYDFLKPDGKLYVPDSQPIIDRISRTRRLALDNGYSIVASTDYHSIDNEEISLEPDMQKTFPPHCMKGEPGAARVGDLGDLPVNYIESGVLNQPLVEDVCTRDQFHIVVRTDTVNMFDNPNTQLILKTVQPRLNIVFGVALDICVNHAVEELLKAGFGRIILLTDVTKAIDDEAGEKYLQSFQQRNVRLATLNEIEQELICTC
ncbi:nicotinamidase/pyrazinamidase [Anaerohalosphaera lusitana]|uniref:nicotinamidase n=1 Tax=Anaerohalosphaera lusitana TaxID=1936003 RepID=A0A1U9NQT3_9BACT|nr:isochorismatase family protein [Anaerohalosphaera lusitana]AQT70292.1 nicotinamidase/pyrazinamidase [Anaerohalosphaera lusitana]